MMIESFWFENVLEYNQIPFTKHKVKEYLIINVDRPHIRLPPIRFEFKDDVLVRVIDNKNTYGVGKYVTLTLDLERGFIFMSGLSEDMYCVTTGFMIDKPSDYK